MYFCGEVSICVEDQQPAAASLELVIRVRNEKGKKGKVKTDDELRQVRIIAHQSFIFGKYVQIIVCFLSTIFLTSFTECTSHMFILELSEECMNNSSEVGIHKMFFGLLKFRYINFFYIVL